mmetsp:Transcript_2605/g.5601  ORF Transcript_2605/g.5601 Transcript_2605/m.5601 type:complete len:223 (-) Transcript_2605:1411-2079(-)
MPNMSSTLGRREINLIRARRNTSIKVKNNLGLRPLILLPAKVIERHCHGTRCNILHCHADPGLGTHFPIRTLCGYDQFYTAVDARGQDCETYRDTLLFGGDEGNILIPSIPIIVPLSFCSILCESGLELACQFDLRSNQSIGNKGSGFLALGHGHTNLTPNFIQSRFQNGQCILFGRYGMTHGRNDGNVSKRTVQFLIGTLRFGYLNGRHFNTLLCRAHEYH